MLAAVDLDCAHEGMRAGCEGIGKGYYPIGRGNAAPLNAETRPLKKARSNRKKWVSHSLAPYSLAPFVNKVWRK